LFASVEQLTAHDQLTVHNDAFIRKGNAEPCVWTKSTFHERRVKARRLSHLGFQVLITAGTLSEFCEGVSDFLLERVELMN
jgi:hypothetical protein